jgi:hypothetical protein
MRNNDITDTRRKIASYVQGGVVTLSDHGSIAQLAAGTTDDEA